MTGKRPNIVFFFWDNLAWGEVGCYGGGVLRGAPTPRIDQLAADGLRLLNFNVEAQCTPSRSALLTGRHPIRSGTQRVRVTGGADGLTRWEVTIAQALSNAGYATGMWGKGLQPGAVHHPLAGPGPGREGQQRAGAPGGLVHDLAAGGRCGGPG